MGSSAPLVSHWDIQGSGGGDSWDSSQGTDLEGNIDADPLFVDAANSDVHLSAASPCIDAGDNTAVSGITTDFEGNDRRIDDPSTVDTGNGTPPIVDMGVDEFSLGIPGDADDNGVVNVLDMTKVARIILMLDAETPSADADQNGVVNVLDMTKIARIILMLDRIG